MASNRLSRILSGENDMALIEPVKQFIVFQLKPEDFKPFTKIRGPITLEPITKENIPDVKHNFSPGKIPVFYDKLQHGHGGVLARHRSDVVGYLWYKDYNMMKMVKADGYVPLKGRFTHLHFGRVAKEMRGRGIQLLMLTHSIRDAYDRSMLRIYTDTQQKNISAMSGFIKIGFRESFRLVVISAFGRTFSIRYQNNINYRNGPDSLDKIIMAELRWITSKLQLHAEKHSTDPHRR
jgi:hypothetical protein